MKTSPQKVQALKKQITHLQLQLKKDKQIYLQQIELLKCEIEDYKRHDLQTRKLNQTVISSYKNNDHARDQILQTSLQELTKKHKQEIQRIVTCHAKNINALEAEIKSLKQKAQSHAEIQEQAKYQIQRSIRVKIEDGNRKQKEQMQNEIRQLKNKNANLESKCRKSEHLLKTYREQMSKIDFESEKNEILKNTSIQYSWLSQMDRKKEQDDMLMSKMYRSKGRNEFQQSRTIRSQTNILNSADLRTVNYDRKHQYEKENRVLRSNRRSTRDILDEVNESARKSRKYLQVSRESLSNLTDRISQAVCSLEKMKKGIPSKKISEVINQRLERKLRGR